VQPKGFDSKRRVSTKEVEERGHMSRKTVPPSKSSHKGDEAAISPARSSLTTQLTAMLYTFYPQNFLKLPKVNWLCG
jgi:hypothetical protein